MRVFYAAETERHAPEFFLLRGRPVANEERAERAERLLAGVAAAGLTPEAPPSAGRAPLAAVHSPRYLDFLETAWAAWQALPGASPEVVANVQPRRGEASYPAGVVGRAGWHMGDLACPVGEFTFAAAVRAADCAVAAADAVAGGAGAAYALARPPGHHTSREVAGGHCFLNNAAIAAERLAKGGARPAVLDIDVHHGNGTQAIFYDRPDVMMVSVHTDPNHFYPWFVGHAHETGIGAGEGTNRNLPLKLGADDAAWHEAIAVGLDTVKSFGADVLVLSLGLDVHESDPLGGMTITTDGIRRAGALIAAAGLPVAIIQEGGYLGPALTDNIAGFLGGFLGAQR
ncbi:histone deacetylase family protein [Acuticoccus mangrovi]|uniref:Histone deacetylase family protein n=1 Tax=Acuticoccus mangrovi TaxID=2796142 RepID=A0A934IQM1_9HYPH|nr:histone deacetylase family protein [Acuticoccus mangrovi]MBJ3776265.1 histone deacetylase family protein [Acuticoccus mangrovi]